ncbi:MAG: hypothetical protein NVS3B10_01670 [Polyangiales bacterium]
MARGPRLEAYVVRLDQTRPDDLAHRPLFPGADDAVPVVILVEDGEPVTRERFETLALDERAFDDAIEDLEPTEDAAWTVRQVAVKGAEPLTILLREHEEGVAVEELLVPAVMDDAAQRLGVGAIAVGVPRRGAILATAADQKWQLVAAFATAVKLQYGGAGDQALFAGVLRVEGGRPVSVIELSTTSLEAAATKIGGAP